MSKTFEVVVGSPEVHAGASLQTVLTKLDSLLKIFHDVHSAILRPGSARVRLPLAIGELTSFRILGASPSKSLAVELQMPSVTEEYAGDYAASLRRVEPAFVATMASASQLDIGRFASLFPEKVDLVRVLNHIKQFAPAPGESAPAIAGLVDSETLVFRNDVAAWATESLPSVSPEPIHLRGLVKSGRLGDRPIFQVFDGNRAIVVDPDAAAIPSFKRHFGQVVDVSGIAEYRNDGMIKRVSKVEEIKPYEHVANIIASSTHELVLRTPIRYKIDTDDRGREFLVDCDEFDIHSYGDTLTEAIDAANDDFLSLWDSIGNAPEQELHESALPLKKRLNEYVLREQRII